MLYTIIKFVNTLMLCICVIELYSVHCTITIYLQRARKKTYNVLYNAFRKYRNVYLQSKYYTLNMYMYTLYVHIA